MNPKQQLSRLDPKLQETYNRVMGTQIASSASQAATPPTPNTAIKPIPEQPTPMSQLTQTPKPEKQMPPVSSKDTDTMAATIAITPAAKNSSPIGFVAPAAQNKKHLSPIVLVLGVIVFFVAYTLIWIKIFNLEIPFLPQ